MEDNSDTPTQVTAPTATVVETVTDIKPDAASGTTGDSGASNPQEGAPKSDTTEPKAGKKRKRKPKNKWAILLGYCGTGYCGLQINNNVPTIEKELL